MFVGHYGVSFVAKRYDPRLPLWLLFLPTSPAGAISEFDVRFRLEAPGPQS